jgi:UDP-N-acetylmuramyl tripeptide synthase
MPAIHAKRNIRPPPRAVSKSISKPLEKNLFVIGITGTNGKTTVAHLIGEVLNASGYNCFVLGTLNSGSKDLSTPDLIDTIKLMKDHLANGGTHFVMEVTSEGFDQDRVLGIEFDLKLLTNITQDHLDYHKTFKHYQSTKLRFMAKGLAHKIYPENYANEKINFPTKLLGEFNRDNMKAAAKALRFMKVPEQKIRDVLSSCSAPRGRLEQVNLGQRFMVVIDYAHTPDGLLNVLTTLKYIATQRRGRLLVLFGCGGNRDASKRPMMGKIASELADIVVITEDNPRKENSQNIMSEIQSGISSEFKHYDVIQDRKKAIDFIVKQAKDNDVVILAGKGHETYQILESGEIDFDEKSFNSRIIISLFGQHLT